MNPTTSTGPASETQFVSTAPVTAPDQPHTNTSRFPHVSPLSSGQSSFSLVLANDGNGWVGTFGIVLSALLSDLIGEGALEASVAYLDDDDEDSFRTGWIVGFDPSDLRIDWADGAVTDGHQVLAVGI